MKKSIFFALILLHASYAFSQPLTGKDILKRIDRNMVVEQALSVNRMIIHGRSGTRTLTSKTWVKGRDKAFVEYLSPAREKGKKMLKIGTKLWSYTPEPHDRIITIAGHLLRQSAMGSDLSYEDMTENDNLIESYTAEIIAEDKIGDHDCHVLELTAKKRDVAYHTRKIWVDKTRWLPLREERFARSGRLLKNFTILESFKFEDRWYPKVMTFKDMLSRGKGTRYIIESIDFQVEIPDYKFTKASLRK